MPHVQRILINYKEETVQLERADRTRDRFSFANGDRRHIALMTRRLSHDETAFRLEAHAYRVEKRRNPQS